MIYLDNGATTLHKPEAVKRAMLKALEQCANPGRGGHQAAMQAAKTVYQVRADASSLFDCDEEQVVFTASCTQGLNTALRTLVKPGSRVLVSGFEHNAVTRPLHALGAKITVAGRKLFDWDNTLEAWEAALRQGVDVAAFTHVSNVFGYILPVEQMSRLCQSYGVPFVIDAAQSAGMLPISVRKLGAEFIAMPGHKGLLGPQGTGILLCAREVHPLIYGGTGSASRSQNMPDFLPDRLEAGTLNVPGIAGLGAGIRHVRTAGEKNILHREQQQARHCAVALKNMGMTVFSGPHQSGTVSFVPPMDCEEMAELLGKSGVAVRAGLHCAPYAHASAGTLETGTVRVSYGHDAGAYQTQKLVSVLAAYL